MNDLNTAFAEEKFSKSELRGLSTLTNDDHLIFSPGVSTGGIAEMKMVQGKSDRKVIGTTLDEKGFKYAQELIEKYGFNSQVKVKIEDVSKPLPYESSLFDFVYARLVLHYLSKVQLDNALKEIYRALKPGRKLFVVVRSVENEELKWEDSSYEEETGFTFVTYTNPVNGAKNIAHRYFHSNETITNHLKAVGFKIDSIISYDEKLYIDFERKIPSPKSDKLIEVVAIK
ncbi:MAG: methyltransferase domain-containing protein [bacterium]|nr:methyltransferase domain-containing protein [bacterium]